MNPSKVTSANKMREDLNMDIDKIDNSSQSQNEPMSQEDKGFNMSVDEKNYSQNKNFDESMSLLSNTNEE